MVHVPRLLNGLSRSTALFYFNSKKDMNQASHFKKFSLIPRSSGLLNFFGPKDMFYL
jgi:hypothetical protein